MLVRPPRYTDEPKTGDYRTIEDGRGRVGRIGKADLAYFMLNQLGDHGYFRRVVVVGY